ncbi:MAG: ROK family protein [Candidatus Dormibacteraeota bacterium]|uniref:ROK family protein n=1 Tax=Candidatus Dormiibacter inghamiae TaxID=3127013 RepID=A0A934KA85_9BACT|nr:ROK family protein [Candidatus Dormibacteraeota bacterium]MBJ7606794.1 ROK family protein [Candidatus Dormibacteraeota bacterium]
MTDALSLHPPARRQPAIRQGNASAVLRAVLAHGSAARSEIAAATGLSAVSVGRQVTDLIGAGVLRELSPVGAELGRPRVPLEIDLHGHRVAGIHIGLHRSSLGVTDLRGNLLRRIELTHDSTEPRPILEQAAQAVETLPERPIGLGIAVGGWVQPIDGTVVENDALGWRNVEVGTLLRERTGVPVWVESNVRAMALAESWLGGGSQAASLAYLFVGNVIGAGIVIRRALHRGPQGAAGAIAHVPLSDRGVTCQCGREGCFQALASDAAVLARADELGLDGTRDLAGLIAIARGGNTQAQGLLRRRARHVGEGVALLIDLLNPELVVLAGSGALDAPEYLKDLRQEASAKAHTDFEAERLIVPSSFGADAIVVGPCGLVLDAVYQRPTELIHPRPARRLSA